MLVHLRELELRANAHMGAVPDELGKLVSLTSMIFLLLICFIFFFLFFYERDLFGAVLVLSFVRVTDSGLFFRYLFLRIGLVRQQAEDRACCYWFMCEIGSFGFAKQFVDYRIDASTVREFGAIEENLFGQQ